MNTLIVPAAVSVVFGCSRAPVNPALAGSGKEAL